MEVQDKEKYSVFYFCSLFYDVNVYIFTLLSFAAEITKKHHTKNALIFGVTGAVVAITILAFGLYALERCRGNKNTTERGLIRVHRVYESIHHIPS